MARHFTNFDAWCEACRLQGLAGPTQTAGLRNFQFADAAGQAAVWDGSLDVGQIFALEDDVPAPSEPEPMAPEPVPESIAPEPEPEHIGEHAEALEPLHTEEPL